MTPRGRTVFALAATIAVAVGAVAVVAFSSSRTEPVILGAPRAASGGAEDLVYGTDGLVRVSIADGSHDVLDAVPSGDEGLFVLGRASTAAGGVGFVLRLGSDGAPVADYGNGGVATLGRWVPDRLAVTGDGGVVVVGGVVDAVLVWRVDGQGRADTPITITVPVPEGDAATGVPISDVVVDVGDAVTVAGGIQVNREEHVGGCCAIEPDSIPFRLRLGSDGEPDLSFGPGGFALEELQPGEGGTAGQLPGSAPRERVGRAQAEAARGDLDFVPVVVTTSGDHVVTVGTGVGEAAAGVLTVARTER